MYNESMFTMGLRTMADRDSERGDRLGDVKVSMSERFMALFEHMQEGVALHEVICDAEGRPVDYRILDINAQYEQHTGIRRAEAAGQLASIVYGTGAPPFLEEFCAVGMGARPIRFETYFAPLDRHFSISVAPLGPKAFATIFSDISLSKRQAEAIEKNRLHQRALLDNQPHLAWLKDREGRFLAVNQAFAEACGQPSPEAVVGKTDFDVWPHELAGAYRADDFVVMESGAQKAVEEEIAGGDGMRWFETYRSPVLAPDGSIVGTTGVSRDITKRKNAEAARLQSERKFERVFDLAPDPIAVTLSTGETLYVNHAFCKATGYSREEMTGRKTLDLGIWRNPGLRAQAMEQLKREGQFDAVEMVLVSKSGDERFMEISGALTELDGQTVMITAARDVTEHRRAEQKAKIAADTLSQYFSLSLDLL
jgi:PAS domain S-box-containing protein